jgi:peptidoglycan/LPS O-acetylase OafA/YrhL
MTDKIQNRFIELDALRGIAAMIVLISHYSWAYHHYFNILKPEKIYFKYGDWGVQFFFIISGFVIFMTLEKVATVREFALARFFRLYPVYWICMFLTLTFLYFLPFPNWGPFSIVVILKNLTMLQGFMRTNHVDQVYWSLCIEVAFYAIMGFVFYIKKMKQIELVCLLWLILSLVVIYFDFPLKKYVVVLLILKYAPLFISGIMFYKIKNGIATVWNHLLVIASFVVFLLIIYTDRIQYDLDFIPFILILIVYATFYFLMYNTSKILRNPILLFLGSISYPLYLLHNVIGYSIITRLRLYTDNIYIYTGITTIITMSLAYLVSKYAEKPLMEFYKIKFSKKKLKQINLNNG